MKKKCFLELCLLVSTFFINKSALIFEDQEKFVIGGWLGGGMGISIIGVLNYLDYCESNNKIPVVYWQKYQSIYYTPAGFNGNNTNVWEYYFEPVSTLKYETGDEIHPYRPYELFSYKNITNETRNRASQLAKKYIKYKRVVKGKIDNFYLHNMAGKINIAIHLRGTDKITEERPVPANVIIKEALKYANKNTNFFIASDEQRLLDEMKKLINKAGFNAIYYDCYRSQNSTAIHSHMPNGYCPNEKIAQYGEDVIVEMALMAKSDILVHTPSNVSAIPLLLNPKLKDILIKI